jgi:hypothetical protein
MSKHVITSIVLLISLAHATLAQVTPRSGLYEISAGEYEECCGIAGGFHYDLPYDRQLFVELNVDRAHNSATMKFLQSDARTVFRPGWSQQSFTFAFQNGMVLSDRIEFENMFGPEFGATSYHYTVQASGDTLTINGTAHQLICCDIPSDFIHTNVLASFMSTSVAIRVSQVEVCWQSIAGRTHQVQYTAALGTNSWTNLGDPVAGDGSRKCVKDDIAPQQPRRIYRVLTMP